MMDAQKNAELFCNPHVAKKCQLSRHGGKRCGKPSVKILAGVYVCEDCVGRLAVIEAYPEPRLGRKPL